VAGIWGQTRNLGARVFGWPDLSKRRSGGGGYRGTRIWGQTRCPVCRSGTSNVQRSTLNSQRGDRKGGWWAGYGDRHDIWAPEFLAGRTCPSAGWAVQACRGTRIWGQTRCRYADQERSTCNVRLSTLKRGDRKGALWAGYGDRHDIWAPEFLAGRTCPSAAWAVEATGAREYGDRHGFLGLAMQRDRHDVRYTDQERST